MGSYQLGQQPADACDCLYGPDGRRRAGQTGHEERHDRSVDERRTRFEERPGEGDP